MPDHTRDPDPDPDPDRERGRDPSLGSRLLPVRLTPGTGRRVAVPLVAGLLALPVVPVVGVALVGLAAFSVWFYRDPEREPAGAGVLAPADGRVSVVREDGDRLRVGVFMSPFDVHVTRAPTAGTVTRLDHRGAAHRPAFAKDSERNERVEFTLERDGGGGEESDGAAENDETRPTRVDGALIAGWFARRITPTVSHGDAVARGERIGHIAFGSRADVVLPPAFERGDLRVTRGEAVRAGESVIARRE